jgi:hypothetical protein
MFTILEVRDELRSYTDPKLVRQAGRYPGLGR